MTMTVEIKKGRPTNEELAFIRANISHMSIKEIAEKLNRTEEFIQDYFNKIKTKDDEDGQELRFKFRHRPEYKRLQQEFSEDELHEFEFQYLQWARQFNNDIFSSEDVQIFLAIKYNILISRCLIEQRKLILDIEDYERHIADIDSRGPSLIDEDKKNRLRYNELRMHAIGAKTSRAKELADLTARHSVLMKELKATREQRIQIIEGAKKTVMELLKSMDEYEFREKEGKQMELAKIASGREKERLYNSHKYNDDNIDTPIYNSESIEDEEDNNTK